MSFAGLFIEVDRTSGRPGRPYGLNPYALKKNTRLFIEELSQNVVLNAFGFSSIEK